MTGHLITPPPERFKQWEDDILNERDNVDHVLDCAWKDGFLAGADQELKACCLELVDGIGRSHAEFPSYLAEDLRAARRPKPPSLREQALAGFERVLSQLYSPEARKGLEAECKTIRCAIEALPND